MKISELMEKLSAAKEKYGDVEVMLYDPFLDGEYYQDNLKEVKDVIYHRERPYWNDINRVLSFGTQYSNFHVVEIVG